MEDHSPARAGSGEPDSSESFFAHTLPDHPRADWQLLLDHLTSVAKLCQEFARAFGSGPWGYLAGLWHDLGKFNPEFQAYLAASSDETKTASARGPEHSGAGAALAQKMVGDYDCRTVPHPLAMIIAGHHAGLSASREAENLEVRTAKSECKWARASGPDPLYINRLRT